MCIPGLPSFETVLALSTNCTIVQADENHDTNRFLPPVDNESCSIEMRDDQNVIYIMPYLNFTCDGRITRWRAGGMPDRLLGFSNSPSLLIWREVNPNMYTRVDEILLLRCDAQEITAVGANAFECELLNQTWVQKGDILGLRLRQTSINSFNPFFSIPARPVVEDDLPTYRFQRRNAGFMFTPSEIGGHVPKLFPLLALEVQSSGMYRRPTIFRFSWVGRKVKIKKCITCKTVLYYVIYFHLLFRNEFSGPKLESKQLKHRNIMNEILRIYGTLINCEH